MKKLGLVGLWAVMAAGCAKDPGYGGTSSLQGKIWIQDYNGSGTLQQEYFAQEERVYLVYGDETFYGDDLRTGWDGTYRFENLYKGSYTVYAYSKCDTCDSGLEPIMITVDVPKNGVVVDVPLITLKK